MDMVLNAIWSEQLGKTPARVSRSIQIRVDEISQFAREGKERWRWGRRGGHGEDVAWMIEDTTRHSQLK
jgi:hypothetical protein